MVAYRAGGLGLAYEPDRSVETDQMFWIGDRVLLDGDGSPDDGTIIDIVIDELGAILRYTVRTEGGGVRDFLPGSVRAKCLVGRTLTSTFPMTSAVRAWLVEHLDADQVLMRDLVRVFAESLMWAETDRSVGRTDFRNGQRPRVLNSRIGKVRLLFPRLRTATYFPEWLVDRHDVADRVLFPYVRDQFLEIVCDGFIEGMTAKRTIGMIRVLGVPRIPESHAASIALAIDDKIKAYRTKRLRARSHAAIRLNVLRCDQAACVVVTDGRTGHPAILDIDVIPAEGQAEWRTFLQSLVHRGLSGVTTVVSEYHEGLEAAVRPDARALASRG